MCIRDRDLILWDVVEEHLDEAAFLWTQWERGLQSPLYKLHELRDRVEERMLAHLDGLVVGGEAVAQRLLYPALTEGLGGIAFAAAMALLLSGRPEAEEAVCSALATAAPPQREEIIRALCLCPSPSRQARLLGLISGEVPPARSAAARILGFQQVDLGSALLRLFQGSDREEWLAGLYGLRYRPVSYTHLDVYKRQEHGRVKVQFHWDREGKKDDHSSCWIRVSQPWGGVAFGGIFIPRIGQEVLLQFLEGDPDRPVVSGRVYNGENPLPYPLPDKKTVSSLKTASSPGGGGYNELRFEDAAGSEEIFLHGQLDMNAVIERDRTQKIGRDASDTIGHDLTASVGHDRTCLLYTSRCV